MQTFQKDMSEVRKGFQTKSEVLYVFKCKLLSMLMILWEFLLSTSYVSGAKDTVRNKSDPVVRGFHRANSL